jgi:Na+-driven multidrug efflux pump
MGTSLSLVSSRLLNVHVCMSCISSSSIPTKLTLCCLIIFVSVIFTFERDLVSLLNSSMSENSVIPYVSTGSRMAFSGTLAWNLLNSLLVDSVCGYANPKISVGTELAHT